MDIFYSILQSNYSGYREWEKLLTNITQTYEVMQEYLEKGDKKLIEDEYDEGQEAYKNAYVVKMQSPLEQFLYLMTFPPNEESFDEIENDTIKVEINWDTNIIYWQNPIFSGIIGNWTALWQNNYTKEQFIEWVKSYHPPTGTFYETGLTYESQYQIYFVDHAEEFYDIATRYGLDPMYIMCKATHESAYGTSSIAQNKGNLFGYKAYDSSPGESASTFDNMAESIETVCQLLRTYMTPGTWQYNRIKEKGLDPTTIEGIESLYATSPTQAQAIKTHLTTIFGITGTSVVQVATNMTDAAANVHKYIRENGYTYSAAYNKSVNLNGNDSRVVDCSSFVTWVILDSGYRSSNFKDGMSQWTSYTYEANPEGWQEISNISQARAGDIITYDGHVEIYAGSLASNGNPLVYNAGGSYSIGATGEISDSSHSISQITKILRVPTI